MLVKGYSKADLALLPPLASCHLIGLPERQLRQDGIMRAGLCLCTLANELSRIWAIRSVPGGELISSGELPMMDFFPSAVIWATAMRNHQTVARISQVGHDSCIYHSVVPDKREHRCYYFYTVERSLLWLFKNTTFTYIASRWCSGLQSCFKAVYSGIRCIIFTVS